MQEKEQQIRCLTAPIEGGVLLLPGSVIAEVSEFDQLRPYKKSPTWLIGSMNWQDWSVPVVSMSMLGGVAEGDAALSGTRVLVIKSLNETATAPYLGILINGLPSMARVRPDQLAESEQLSKQPCVFSEVTINEKQALIPDLDTLSEQVEIAIKDE